MSPSRFGPSPVTRFSLLCATSALAIATSVAAQAQDIPTVPTSGLYAGIHTGYANGAPAGSAMYGIDSDALVEGEALGLIGGVQLGYDFLAGSNLLIGGELSASLAHSADSQVQTNFGGSGETLSFDRELSGLALAQGKLGWAAGGVSVYGLGGVALATGSVDGNVSDGEGATSFSGDTVYNGWTLGVGADLAVTPNVSIGAAYNYVDLTADDIEENGVTVEQELQSHIGKLVLNYHF